MKNPVRQNVVLPSAFPLGQSGSQATERGGSDDRFRQGEWGAGTEGGSEGMGVAEGYAMQ